MNRRRIAFLAPLFAVLALLLGLTETASAAFNPSAQNPHYGNFLLRESEASASEWLQLADPIKENGEWIYDSALGVPVYVRQNPWTFFDPLGLWEENAHFKKWSSRAADPNQGFFSRMAAIPMAIGEGLNPFRSDSNLRQGGREFQKNAAIAREQLKDAPPVIREIGQLTMGVANAGASPLTLPAGLGEMGDSIQQVGPVQTGKNMATGIVDHATSNPFEFVGEMAVPSAIGKSFLGKSSRVVAESNSLAGFKAGQGFSGVFDPGSGSLLFRPSTYGEVLDGWVPAKGGHVDVFKESGFGADAQGFTAFLKEGGDLSVQWKSGLNEAPGGVLPKPQRQPVLEALEKKTGRKTYSDE